MTFKRKISNLESGDYRPVGSVSTIFLGAQPVRLIKEDPSSDLEDDAEDRYIVETYAGSRFTVDECDLHPMPRTPETNTEFVTRLMEEGGRKSGALIQPFVLEAIRIYAEQVRAGPASHFGNAMISGEAWKRAADDALDMLQERNL